MKLSKNNDKICILSQLSLANDNRKNMKLNYPELLQKTEHHVNMFYTDHADANLFYHNQNRATEVLEKTKKIAKHYYLDDRTFFIVCAAACFTNLGYLIKSADSHKMESAKLAHDFFTTLDVSEPDIVAIEKCILATQAPQNTVTLTEKIICDAVLYYLGEDGFIEKNELFKKEKEAFSNTKIDNNAWVTSTINLLENHKYHTEYCQLLLNKTKAANLEQLRNMHDNQINIVQAGNTLEAADANQETIEGEVDHNSAVISPKKVRPKRGVETMLRIVAAKNIRVSEMADGKANIMISINSIIISVILGLLASTLRENQNLIIPIIILLTVNVGTIIFSVLATRPKISDGRFTREDVTNRSVNLLYFGSFYKMNFKEFDEGFKEMMEDRDFLYGTLSKDTYWQGKVLGRKFRLLRISYTIFLYGIVVAVFAFLAAVIFF